MKKFLVHKLVQNEKRKASSSWHFLNYCFLRLLSRKFVRNNIYSFSFCKILVIILTLEGHMAALQCSSQFCSISYCQFLFYLVLSLFIFYLFSNLSLVWLLPYFKDIYNRTVACWNLMEHEHIKYQSPEAHVKKVAVMQVNRILGFSRLLPEDWRWKGGRRGLWRWTELVLFWQRVMIVSRNWRLKMKG